MAETIGAMLLMLIGGKEVKSELGDRILTITAIVCVSGICTLVYLK